MSKILTCFLHIPTGLYHDQQLRLRGAPGLYLIHTDGSSNKKKEKDERDRQRMGEQPIPKTVSDKYKQFLSDVPEVGVTTTSSGSQTQEAFVDFCQHFVNSLPKNHEPAILFLDGHASRWSANGLHLLVQNKVFPFFIPSHTSIWAQPNDCKCNRWLHESMEKAASKLRCSDTAPLQPDYPIRVAGLPK